jgi:hypothetical protein
MTTAGIEADSETNVVRRRSVATTGATTNAATSEETAAK